MANKQQSAQSASHKQSAPPADGAKSGVAPSATSNTDRTRNPARAVEEEDIFGGAERTRKGKDVDSGSAKP